MTIQITSYGHACFKVEDGEDSILFDPYAVDSVPGLTLPTNIKVSVVSCSHEHADHNAKDQVEETKPNENIFQLEKITVPHDDADGTLRGFSNITIVHVEGKKIVHFGDIGRLPTIEEYEKLNHPDIIMIPCGGHYTIDAMEAKTIVDKLQPDVTILMHYHKGNRGYDVLVDIEDIKKVFPNVKELSESSFLYDKKENGIVITLEPKQA